MRDILEQSNFKGQNQAQTKTDKDWNGYQKVEISKSNENLQKELEEIVVVYNAFKFKLLFFG